MPIAENYLRKLKMSFRTPVERFSPAVQELFLRYPWQGNVRELQNAVEYAAALGERVEVQPEDLPPKLRVWMETPERSRAKSAKRGVQQEEQARLQQLLEKYGQTLEGKKRIAAELNISLRTLYRRLEACKLG